MSQKMVKWLSASSLMLLGAFIWGCSESESSPEKIISNGGSEFQKNDATGMWARIDELGIAGYFDSLSKDLGTPVISGTALVNGRCAAPALAMDENTRYLDELESLFDEGEQVEGVCGKGLKLKDGQVAPLGVNLIDSMKVGTVEFWFRPGEGFYDAARTLLGNDGSRIHFFYKNGELYFQKNHHNLHYYVKGKATLNDDWNLIAGQWGDGYMSVWVNGKLIARMEHTEGYAPAQRGIPFENLVVIGYKSSCCMEGPGQYEAMTTSGSFDQFRISNIPRYKMTDVVADELDTLSAEPDTIPADSIGIIWAIDTLKPVPQPLWSQLNRYGSDYLANLTLPVASAAKEECASPALAMDDFTLYLDELDAIYQEGELVDGVCGKALSLKTGEVAPTGINLIDAIPVGTVEFWFRPGENFYDAARTLLGNDGARIHFFYKNGELYFQKNHADLHYFVKGEVKFKNDDWNLIAGQWGDGNLSLWVNGEEVASIEHSEGYKPADRGYPYENWVVIGFKSGCCMEDPGQYASMMTSGAYDQLRISRTTRYVTELDVQPADSDTVLAPVDTVAEISPVTSSSSFDSAYFGKTYDLDTLFLDQPIILDTVPTNAE